MEKTKLSDLTFGHLIRFVREIALIIVLSTLLIGLFSGDLRLDFTKLSASELVSFLLAFFSISLSAAFYFAATNASTKFYDYINKFNSSTSELLGRLDEQIKTLNIKQQEIGDRIDRQYLKGREDIDQKSEENEAAISEVEAEWENTLKDALAQAGIEEEQRKALEIELKRKEAELSELREEQAGIKARRIQSLKDHIRSRISKHGLAKALNTPPNFLLLELCKTIVPPAKRDLFKYGFILRESPEKASDISQEGIELVKNVVMGMAANKLDGEE